MDENRDIVRDPDGQCPGIIRKFVGAIYRHTGFSLLGRPTFDYGFVVGTDKNVTHITPNKAKQISDLAEAITPEQAKRLVAALNSRKL